MMLLVACAVLLVFYLVYFLVSEYVASRYLPPGPFPLPIIGNLHLLSDKPYLDFYRISKIYGPVCRLQMGYNRVIVINNYEYVKEAMIKKGTDFAGRPIQYVGNLFSRGGKGVGFQTYNDVLKQENGKTHSAKNLTNALLEEAEAEKSQGHVNMSDDHIMMTVNDALIAGSETPSTTTLWALYYLIKYPDVQKRIQRELDQVIGRNRALKWSERQDLPYLQGFMIEVFRHSGAMPLAIPHQTIRDTSLGPYQIPEGTMVIVNQWAINRDSDVWESPMEFKPERFLDANGRFSQDCAAKMLAFGLGHRSCPGETLSKMEIFMFTSQMLQKFDFKQVEGEVLPETTESSFGIVMRPAPFNICITPRN